MLSPLAGPCLFNKNTAICTRTNTHTHTHTETPNPFLVKSHFYKSHRVTLTAQTAVKYQCHSWQIGLCIYTACGGKQTLWSNITIFPQSHSQISTRCSPCCVSMCVCMCLRVCKQVKCAGTVHFCISIRDENYLEKEKKKQWERFRLKGSEYCSKWHTSTHSSRLNPYRHIITSRVVFGSELWCTTGAIRRTNTVAVFYYRWGIQISTGVK